MAALVGLFVIKAMIGWRNENRYERAVRWSAESRQTRGTVPNAILIFGWREVDPGGGVEQGWIRKS